MKTKGNAVHPKKNKQQVCIVDTKSKEIRFADGTVIKIDKEHPVKIV